MIVNVPCVGARERGSCKEIGQVLVVYMIMMMIRIIIIIQHFKTSGDLQCLIYVSDTIFEFVDSWHNDFLLIPAVLMC